MLIQRSRSPHGQSSPLLPTFLALVLLPIFPLRAAGSPEPAGRPETMRFDHPRTAAALMEKRVPRSADPEAVTFIEVGRPPEGDTPVALAFSPDGRTILVVNQDSDNVTFYDVDTRRVTATVPVAPLPCHVAVTPDGRYALVGHYVGSQVSVIDLAARSPLPPVAVTGDGPYRIEVAADGAFAAVGMINDSVHSALAIIDLESLEEVASIPTPGQGIIGGSSTPALGIGILTTTLFRLTPDGRTLLVPVYTQARLAVFDRVSGAEIASIPTTPAPWDLDVSADGTFAILGHELFEEGSGRLTKIDLTTFRVSAVFPLSSSPFFQRNRILPDGRTALVTGDLNPTGQTRFVDLEDGAIVGQLTTGKGDEIAVTADGRHAVLTANPIYVFDLATRQIAATLPWAGLWQMAASPSSPRVAGVNSPWGEEVYVYHRDGAAWGLEAIVPSGEVPEGDAPRAVDLSPDGNLAVVGNQISDNVAVLDLAAGRLRSLVPAGEWVTDVAVTPDGRTAVAVGSSSQSLSVIDLADDRVIADLLLPDVFPSQLLLAPDGGSVLVAGARSVSRVELAGAASAVTATVEAPLSYGFSGYNLYQQTPSRSAELSGDGRVLVVTGNAVDQVAIYDARSLERLDTVEVCSFPYQVAISHTGAQIWVACAFSQQLLHLQRAGDPWNAGASLPVANPFQLRLDADGRYLYASSLTFPEATLRVIDTTREEEVLRLPLPWFAESMRFGPDGLLYVAGADPLNIDRGAVLRLRPAGAETAVLDGTPVSASAAELAVTADGTVILSQLLLDGVDVVRSTEARCLPGATVLCLLDGRFEISATWRDGRGRIRPAKVAPSRTEASGILWFASSDNYELLIKVLDGCRVNGRYWVFVAATTNLGLELRVIDRLTGLERRYTNPAGTRARTITDTQAFPTCP